MLRDFLAAFGTHLGDILGMLVAFFGVTYTPNKGYAQPTVNGDTNTWGTELNSSAAVLDTNMGGVASVNVAGSSNVTANATQAQNLVQRLTGALTGNISYILPPVGSFYVIDNQTSGNFILTVLTSAGGSVGVSVPQGTALFVYSDGTNVYPCDRARTNGIVATKTDFPQGGQFRAVAGDLSYGFMIENAGGAGTFFLLTNLNDPYGIYNSLRPIGVNNATGAVSLDGTGAGCSTGGAFTVGDGLTVTTGGGSIGGLLAVNGGLLVSAGGASLDGNVTVTGSGANTTALTVDGNSGPAPVLRLNGAASASACSLAMIGPDATPIFLNAGNTDGEAFSIYGNTTLLAHTDYSGNWITMGNVVAGGYLQPMGAGKPVVTAGSGAPSAAYPAGSIFMRTDGSVGTRLYVSQGGGSWLAVAGV